MTFERSQISLAVEQNANQCPGLWSAAAQADYLAEAKGGKPVGKAQLALMTYLQKSHKEGGGRGWGEQALTDVVRHPMFRGMHFGKVSKAASVLAKKGLVTFDGKTIAMAESAPAAPRTENQMAWLSRGSRTGQLTEASKGDKKGDLVKELERRKAAGENIKNPEGLARYIGKKKGVVEDASPSASILREMQQDNTPEEMVRIFDSLKPKQKILVSMKSVMGMSARESGDYHEWIVGRRSESKKYGVTTITLLQPGGPKPTKYNRYALMKRKSGKVSAAHGDMAMFLLGLKRPQAEDASASAAILREAKTGYTDDELVGYLKGQKKGTYVTANVLKHSFGGTSSSHAATLKRLVKAGKLTVMPGKTLGKGSMYGLTENVAGEFSTGGFSRDAKFMPDDTREKVLQARAMEIEAFANDRGYDPRIVMAIAEVSMRMGRVPDLRQYGVYGEDALAIRHFIAGDVLNLAIEDTAPSASILLERRQ